MLRKLFSWIWQKPVPTQQINIFRPKERLLYRYWDGKVMREADPLVIYRKIMDKRASLSADMTAVEAKNSKFSADAHKNMIATIRSIFDVKGMEESGLSEYETSELLDHFMVFAESLKKSSDLSQTLPETTLPSMPPTSGEGSPTSNSSRSGSTETENRIEESTSSPKAAE